MSPSTIPTLGRPIFIRGIDYFIFLYSFTKYKNLGTSL
nr:MAG TPA: hypothetical protein [Caudoviricetes sp.]